MEQTGPRTGSRCRLVLGFDAGCMTCSELAKRIEERVGDKIEVRSLNDPMMDLWRREVFGEAPTLVEVEGGKVRAWTGARMGVRLSRALGPVATWRVMQVLGEANADLQLTDSLAANAVSGLTRRQFLKGVGGAVFAMSILGGTGNRAPAAGAATSVRYEEIFGEELNEVARAVVTRRDIVNVSSETWRKKIRNGRVIQAEIADMQSNRRVSIKAIDLDNGRISPANGKPNFSGDLAVVKAARHVLSDENSMLAVSFAMPKYDQIIAYHEYEEPAFLPQDQVKTKAEALLYQVEGESADLKKASPNNQLQTLQQSGTPSTLEEASISLASARAARHSSIPVRP